MRGRPRRLTSRANCALVPAQFLNFLRACANGGRERTGNWCLLADCAAIWLEAQMPIPLRKNACKGVCCRSCLVRCGTRRGCDYPWRRGRDFYCDQSSALAKKRPNWVKWWPSFERKRAGLLWPLGGKIDPLWVEPLGRIWSMTSHSDRLGESSGSGGWSFRAVLRFTA